MGDVFLISNIEKSNKTEIVNGFNSFFANIGKSIGDAIIQPNNNFADFLQGNHADNLFMLPTDHHEIISVTSKLKSSTSQGFDSISMLTITSTIQEVATPLAHIVKGGLYTLLVLSPACDCRPTSGSHCRSFTTVRQPPSSLRCHVLGSL